MEPALLVIADAGIGQDVVVFDLQQIGLGSP